jgi:hypothetical protein
MASEIIVNTIKAPTTGANANKIIVGSGQELDASAGLITPAGHVIQMKNSTLAGGGDVSNTTAWTSTGNTINITPLKAGSKIMVHYTHVMRITAGASHTRADLRLIESVSGTVIVDERYVGEESTDGGKDPIQNFSGTGVYTTSDTNQRTFVLQFRVAAASSPESGNIYYKWYTGATHTMQALEIAQ